MNPEQILQELEQHAKEMFDSCKGIKDNEFVMGESAAYARMIGKIRELRAKAATITQTDIPQEKNQIPKPLP